MTLRSKLYTLFGVTLALSSALTTWLLLSQTMDKLRDELVDNTDAALILAGQAVVERAETDGQLTDEAIREEVSRALSVHADIINADVIFVGSGRRLDVDLRDLPAAWTPDTGAGLSRVTDVQLPGRALQIVAWVDDSIVRALRARVVRSFIGSAGLAMIVSLVILGWGTDHLVTTPLARLRKQVEHVAEGRLEARLGKLRRRSDEIGVLARSVQNMIEALDRASSENDKLITQMRGRERQLDDHVAEATAELRRTHGELEMAHTALLAASEQLGRLERLAALGQLSGTIAHELGTPLSTISGHLELLLHEDLPGETREAIGVAHQEAARMTDIIRRYLSSTRGMQALPEEIILEELVDQCLGMALPPGDRGRFTVEVDIHPDAAQPFMDRGLLRQVLINLITNARDAMAEVGGLLRIHASRAEEDLILDVDDAGPGVPPEDRRRIFEPFFTTKSPDHGTGLGLAICVEIARTLSGAVLVGDAPQGGARFTLRIPAFDPRQRGSL